MFNYFYWTGCNVYGLTIIYNILIFSSQDTEHYSARTICWHKSFELWFSSYFFLKMLISFHFIYWCLIFLYCFVLFHRLIPPLSVNAMVLSKHCSVCLSILTSLTKKQPNQWSEFGAELPVWLANWQPGECTGKPVWKH